eukprot:TRINITY_DN8038_c0_g1_i2.p2 TRINITY_DN8038_c0_g1~~TRINITY_DN8038_c0_g1_i2.p2  ORF type:complete len:707 (-),score=190.81 TRINITY_DN8038_c0_g1_i2:2177-4297(-)
MHRLQEQVDAIRGSFGGMGNAQQMQEDFVEYHLYTRVSECNNVADVLARTRQAYLRHTEKITKDYIWQHDPFHLKISDESDCTLLHMFGRTRVGDNQEDLWTIVYMLCDLTRIHDDLAVRVWDIDGEFLLIEAAEGIPRWLGPENAAHRTWIHRGHLHIVPLPRTPAEVATIPSNPSCKEALAMVLDPACRTSAPDADAYIQKRLDAYPAVITDHQHHHVGAWVPLGVALMLLRAPWLIAPMVTAFYHRDAEDLRACGRLFGGGSRTPSRPGSSTPTANAPTPHDDIFAVLVYVSVRFTRTLYAMLVQQQFHPPIGYPPLPSVGDPQYRAREIGTKLACAFEMLYARSPRKDVSPGPVSQDADLSTHDWKGDDAWQAYRHRLVRMGFFREEKEGSKLYRELEDKARREYWQGRTPHQEAPNNTRHVSPHIGALFDAILHETTPTDKMVASVTAPADFRDSSDDWMVVAPEAVDKLLHERGRASKGKGAADDEEAGLQDIQDLVGNVQRFVSKASGFEGAEFTSKDDVQLDPSHFMRAMKKALGMDEDEDEGTDDEDGSTGEDASDDEGLNFGSDDEDISDGEENEEEQEDSTNPTNTKDEYDYPDFYAELMGPHGMGGGRGIREAMHLMDEELQGSALANDFERVTLEEESGQGPPTGPVDIDVNLVKNLLESYSTEHGIPGPVSGLLAGFLGRGSQGNTRRGAPK